MQNICFLVGKFMFECITSLVSDIVYLQIIIVIWSDINLSNQYMYNNKSSMEPEKEPAKDEDKDDTCTKGSLNSYEARIRLHDCANFTEDINRFTKGPMHVVKTNPVEQIIKTENKPVIDFPKEIKNSVSVNLASIPLQQSQQLPESIIIAGGSTSISSNSTNKASNYYAQADPNYRPTTFNQSYSQFKEEYFKLPEVSEDRLKEHDVLCRTSEISSEVALSETIELGDWVNISDGIRSDGAPSDMITELDKALQCQDSRMFLDKPEKDFSRAEYNVLLSGFKIRVILINKLQKAPTIMRSQYIAKGAFGFILKENIDGKVRVTKRTFFRSINDQDNYRSKREVIQSVIREYALIKLLSCFSFGPGIASINGVEIECYQDCVVFGMQKCLTTEESIEELKLNKEDFLKKFKRDIKENLLWMHNYHLIHRDIKLSNCMYNPLTGRFVLVDFGISQPVNQNYQTRTNTAYCGTLEYMTNEIRALRLMKGNVGLVNLYEGDMYAYDITINKMEKVPFKNESKDSKSQFVLQVKQTAKQKLRRLLQMPLSPTVLVDIVSNLSKIEDEKEIFMILRTVKDHGDLTQIIGAFEQSSSKISETMHADLSILKNLQLFLDEQFIKYNEVLILGERELEFKIRILGCDAQVEQLWQKYIQGLDSIKQAQRIEQLNTYIKLEKDTFISYDSPQSIRRLSGIRISYIQAIKSYYSILRCKGKYLSWLDKAKIYIELVWAEKAANMRSIIADNPNWQKLKHIFLTNHGVVKTRNEAFLECVIKIWQSSSQESFEKTEEYVNKFIEKYRKDNDICICIRALGEAYDTASRQDKAYQLIEVQEEIRREKDQLNTPQAVVMYFCKYEYTPHAQDRINIAKEGIHIFDSINKKEVRNFGILEAFIYQIRGQFLKLLLRDAEAMEQYAQLLEYYRIKRVKVSARMAMIKTSMIQILSRNGEYEKALQMITDIMNSRLEIAGNVANATLETIYDVCLLNFRRGDFLSARNRFQELQEKFKNPEVEKSQQLKKYEMLCLRMQVELDAHEFTAVKDILKDCEKVYYALLKKQSKVKPVFPLLSARYYARQRNYGEAQKYIQQINQELMETPQDMTFLILVELEVLALQKKYNNLYLELLSKFDKSFEKIGRDARLESQALLFKALYLINQQQIDLAKAQEHCMKCVKLLHGCQEHPLLGQAYWLLSQLSLLRGDETKFKEYQERSEKVFENQRSWLKEFCRDTTMVTRKSARE